MYGEGFLLCFLWLFFFFFFPQSWSNSKFSQGVPWLISIPTQKSGITACSRSWLRSAPAAQRRAQSPAVTCDLCLAQLQRGLVGLQVLRSGISRGMAQSQLGCSAGAGRNTGLPSALPCAAGPGYQMLQDPCAGQGQFRHCSDSSSCWAPTEYCWQDWK